MKKTLFFLLMAGFAMTAGAQIVITQTQGYTYKEPYQRVEGLFASPYMNFGLPLVAEVGVGIGWQFNKCIAVSIGLGWQTNKIMDKHEYRYAFNDNGYGPFASCDNNMLNTLPLYLQATFYTDMFKNFPLFISGHAGIANGLTTLRLGSIWSSSSWQEFDLKGGLMYGIRAGFSIKAADIYFVGTWFGQHYEEVSIKDKYFGIGTSFHIPFDADKLLGR